MRLGMEKGTTAQSQKRRKKANQLRTTIIRQQKVPYLLFRELLRILFTHNGFLKFLDRLIFDEGFKVTIEST